MYLYFLDESGGNNKPLPFVMAGVGIEASEWTRCEHRLQLIKNEYKIGDNEIHSSVLWGGYKEQELIPDFDSLGYEDRRARCEAVQREQVLSLKAKLKAKQIKQMQEGQEKRKPYLHLTLTERHNLLEAFIREFVTWKKVFWTAVLIEHENSGQAAVPAKKYGNAFIHTISSVGVFLEQQNKKLAKTASVKNAASTLCVLVHDVSSHAGLAATITPFFNNPATGTHFGSALLYADSKHANLLQLADACTHAVRIYRDKKDDRLVKILLPKLEASFHSDARHGCDCVLCSIYSD